jgi:magnesium and cobalt transporter
VNEDRSSLTRRLRVWLAWLRKTFYPYPKGRQELTELLRALEQRDLIHPEALVMIEGALLMAEMRVRDIMVPRAQMVMVEADAELDDLLPTVIDSGHSRFPVLDLKRDQVVGVLLAKDLLLHLAKPQGTRFDLRDVLRPPVFIPESKRLQILLREFRNSRNHMAVVVDEYGQVAGLVTIEDVIEQVVGEIADEHDTDEEGYIKKHRDDRYTVKARTPIDEFNRYFHTGFPEQDFDTIGGFVLQAIGHVPARGEAIKLEGLRFTVLRADPRRIHLLRVTRRPERDAEAPPEQHASAA